MKKGPLPLRRGAGFFRGSDHLRSPVVESVRCVMVESSIDTGILCISAAYEDRCSGQCRGEDRRYETYGSMRTRQPSFRAIIEGAVDVKCDSMQNVVVGARSIESATTIADGRDGCGSHVGRPDDAIRLSALSGHDVVRHAN
nr:hypothetical protein Iba_chr11eCG6020 [Ipomoea batatas]